ncbi:hypothetical protein [Streptomyces ureilyticus]|uniref:Uncharacterized protein n=1 Tax=Streptomyces ureilyticus TaxID=1775131 RepID=A0ABX0DLX5_9ACTN|nr:hypothetical protein [Streptomyces ureilyticus]NGO42867.1 hypothetical protein [Streptomyces ureilyticus]
MDATWAIAVVIEAQTTAVMVLPNDGRAGLKALVATVSLLLGEAMLVGGMEGEILLAAMALLSGGLLFLAELAASRDSQLVPLLWLLCGGWGLVLMVWRRDELVEWMETNRSDLAAICLSAAFLLGTLAMRRRRLGETR